MFKDYKEIIARSIKVEAGYVNNPNDKGGETNHGITAATAAEFKADLVRLFSWDGTMKNLTTDMAWWIYKTGWWDRLYLDEIFKIHPFLADRLFDFGINAGRTAAVTGLQRILNVMNRGQQDYADIIQDGAMGKGTLAALNSYIAKRGKVGILNLLQLLIDRQGWYYVEISEKRELNEEFMTGWVTRVREANEFYQSELNK